MILWKSWLIALTFCVSVLASNKKPGYCSMYDNCGKKSFFGAQLPCVNNTRAPAPSRESLEILTRVCGAEFPVDDGVCCSYDQLVNLELNLKKVDPLISSCPACRKNFYDFFCKFTCSSDQATFIEITGTSEAIDTQNDIVTELTLFTATDYAQAFFDSCKNLKFSATNGFAMDLIGGGAKNYSQFLKFLGDEKPLLGGSPFQINFEYELNKDELKKGTQFCNGSMKACDDAVYKCACSDCPTSCPALPGFHDFGKTCKVGILPCFSFIVMITWIVIILLIGGYHVYIARQRRRLFERLNSIFESEFISDEDDDEILDGFEDEENVIEDYISPAQKLKLVRKWIKFRNSLIDSIELSFAKIGLTCATFPGVTIVGSLILALICCTGLTKLQFETNPVNLWVSPDEPAFHNLQYFESNFGEWFRIEQLFISSNNHSQPVLSWDTVQWWFEKEQELQELKDQNGEAIRLDSFCYKPLGETCAIESFAQYFRGEIQYLSEGTWAKELISCTESPVTCLPTFQQPLKKNLLFSLEKILESEAFVVTLLLNSDLKNEKYTQQAIAYEHALQKWITKIQKERPDLKISFSTEVSLLEELNKSTNTDVKIVVISYLVMFLYASVALGGKIPTSFKKKNLVMTRFQLGLGGIVIILFSVAASAGVCAVIGIKSTFIIAEVIPFLVLAIGVDNIFLIVHEMHVVSEVSPHLSVEARISLALEKIGPSCLISAILQVLMFLLATNVQMPALRNFAFYSAGAVAINFLLQMTAFVALLSLDQKRLESGRVDCAPWIQISNQIEIGNEAEHVEYNFSSYITDHYAPWLLKPSNKRKIFTVFLIWLGVSLSLLPRVELGLDQRLALPKDSYLVDYFNSIYDYLNVGPPTFFVVKNLDVTERASQQKVCGKFSTCEEFSLANILEQEYKRGDVSTIAEPASNWLDDFLTWLNPNLDQCCRFKKSAFGEEFCSPNAPLRQCESCYADHSPPYNILMEGLPTGAEFMKFFNQWITEPSDPCPLGGKAPYGTTVNYNETSIKSSYFRTSHSALRSQDDFIVAYKNSLRIVEEMEKYSNNELEIFAFSPFYIFFVQYDTILSTTFSILTVAAFIIWCVSGILLGLMRTATILVATVLIVLVNIGGVMAMWSISLNPVSLVNLIICLGLAVEFTVHLSKAYLTATQEESEEDLYNSFMNLQEVNFLQDRKPMLAFKALRKVGGSVLGGITITKFIGIAVLAFTRSKIFEVYYFRMWLSLVVIAAAHSLVLLPILLSMFGEE